MKYDEIMTYAEGKKLSLSEELVWERNQIVLRFRRKSSPFGFASDQDYQKAIALWEEKVKTYKASRTYQLIFNDISMNQILIGRKRELDKIHSTLSNDDHSKVLLYGLGGIGKSALAIDYAEQYKEAYDGVIFLLCQKTLIETIVDDQTLPIHNLMYSPDIFRSKRTYFNKKWSVFTELLTKGKYLLLFDDLPKLTEAEWKKISELPCNVILTSREFNHHWHEEAIYIDSLKDETEWSEFYQTYFDGQLTDEEKKSLQEFNEKVSGNTLLMRMALSNFGYSTIADMDSYFLGKETLTKNERQVLQYLSLLPARGMKLDDFLYASEISESVFDQLASRCFVQIKSIDHLKYCNLHPVIREVVMRNFPPTAHNCIQFLKGAASLYYSIWNCPFSEVLSAIPVCRSILQTWKTPSAWLSDAFDTFITVLWIGGYFDEAEYDILKLFDACESYYGSAHQETGRIALRVAAVYHNSMQFEKAFHWYEKGYDILCAADKVDEEYHFLCMETADSLSRHYRHNQIYTKAKEYWKSADEHWKQYMKNKSSSDTQHQKKYLLHRLEKSKIYLKEKNYQEAEDLCRDILKQHELQFGTDNYTHIEMLTNLTEILLMLKEYHQAEQLALYCMEKAAYYRGSEMAKETLAIKELLADIYRVSGNHERSFTMYSEVLDSLLQYYPYQTVWHRQIKNKQKSIYEVHL